MISSLAEERDDEDWVEVISTHDSDDSGEHIVLANSQ
jgi:hypothetical protein